MVIIDVEILIIVGYIKKRIEKIMKEEKEEREREFGIIEEKQDVVFRKREKQDKLS